MRFGQEFICNICKKNIMDEDYHRYTTDMLGMDMMFYACDGECNKKFREEYVDPFEEEPEDIIENRWQILDIR
jgi:hypothetical protein